MYFLITKFSTFSFSIVLNMKSINALHVLITCKYVKDLKEWLVLVSASKHAIITIKTSKLLPRKKHIMAF